MGSLILSCSRLKPVRLFPFPHWYDCLHTRPIEILYQIKGSLASWSIFLICNVVIGRFDKVEIVNPCWDEDLEEWQCTLCKALRVTICWCEQCMVELSNLNWGAWFSSEHLNWNLWKINILLRKHDCERCRIVISQIVGLLFRLGWFSLTYKFTWTIRCTRIYRTRWPSWKPYAMKSEA